MYADLLFENLHLATMDPSCAHGLPARQPQAGTATACGAIHDAALAVHAGRILWLGPRCELPDVAAAARVDGQGGWLTPGLIDCHTHLVHGGNRAHEFAARCAGASYEAIARAGGGIRATVAATRAASDEELLRSALARLDALRREGVTTVEVKSGYGLDLPTELRMLRVARALARERPVTVRTTLLAAHALPETHAARADAFIDFVCSELLPAAAREGLADAVDVFCEHLAFPVALCERVFEAAHALGLPVKAHAEQLSYLGGARAASARGALSVDHLEYLREEDAAILGANGTVAVLLPGAFYFLGQTQRPPVAALRRHGVPMAVATDLNPGTAPMASLLLALNQSCVLFGLTPAEALAGATREAARALGLGASKGMLRTGFDADLALWEIGDPAELAYAINLNRPRAVWHGGVHVAAG
jgi:imidazolonepropionase